MREQRRLGRATIAIYNSYDPNNFREAHRRILARAGPLALAFDCNLVTIGFPFPQDLTTPQQIADWVSTTTSIGEDGSYLKDVASRAGSPPSPTRQGIPAAAGGGRADHLQPGKEEETLGR